MSDQIFSYTNHSRMVDPEIFISGYDDIVETKKNRYYDLTSGLWNVNYGYKNIEFDRIIERQVAQIQFYSNHFWSSTPVAEQASTAICNYFNMGGVYFGTGGSDAIRTANYISKFCRPNKSEIICLDKAYHGVDNSATPCIDLISQVNDNTAAVIIEPIMTTAGVISVDKNILLELNELRKKLGFLIVFDNTVTGFGRADLWFGINPDILVVSKGLTNGLFPFSATLVNDELMHYILTTNKVFDYGITMASHPIGCALMIKSLEMIEKSKSSRSLIEQKMTKQLDGLKYRNYGLLFGVDVPDGDNARKALKKMGYLLRNHENTLIIAPMFNADIAKYQSCFEYLRSIA